MSTEQIASTGTPRQVLERFYEAERDYMRGGDSGNAGFDAMQATLDPEVVLHLAQVKLYQVW